MMSRRGGKDVSKIRPWGWLIGWRNLEATDNHTLETGNGGAKLVHGSGGIVSLRAEQNSAT